MDSRELLLKKLRLHKGVDEHEESMRLRIIRFIEGHADCFHRSLLEGHITASALVVNADKTKTLMTHHHKLNKWLQLGGHSDGDPDPLNVALREVKEESGLKNVVPLSEKIFDVDVHEIPERKNEPAHVHYDIRFLFQAHDGDSLTISNESKDLAWIPLHSMDQYTAEESILRMIRKLSAMKEQ